LTCTGDTSLLHLSTLALAYLHKYRSVSYHQLYTHLKKRVGRDSEDVRVMFGPTVSFLFLLGKLQYHPKGDSFEIPRNGTQEAMKLSQLYSNNPRAFPRRHCCWIQVWRLKRSRICSTTSTSRQHRFTTSGGEA
jgi:hypothetical protein